MIYEVYERLDLGANTAVAVDEQLVLDHLQRERGRFKAESQSGAEIRVFLERGKTLQIGEILRSQCGHHIVVTGAEEAVMEAECADWEMFARACYHLGNRHVKLQIDGRRLRIVPDHVLGDMLIGLGLEVRETRAVFVPESGAYGAHRHGHSHSHAHDGHSHSHSHSHSQSHEREHSDDGEHRHG